MFSVNFSSSGFNRTTEVDLLTCVQVSEQSISDSGADNPVLHEETGCIDTS